MTAGNPATHLSHYLPLSRHYGPVACQLDRLALAVALLRVRSILPTLCLLAEIFSVVKDIFSGGACRSEWRIDQLTGPSGLVRQFVYTDKGPCCPLSKAVAGLPG